MGFNNIEYKDNLEDHDDTGIEPTNVGLEGDLSDYKDMQHKYDTAIVILQGGTEEGCDGDKVVPRARLREQAGVIAYLDARLRGENAVIILSGRESAVMKDSLVNHRGIPEEDIILEIQSYTTATNALYTGQILTYLGLKDKGRVQLITNGFHLDRSIMHFNNYYGGNIEPINAEEYLSVNRPDRYLLPGDQMAHPYALFAKKFVGSSQNKIWEVMDNGLRIVEGNPTGKSLIDGIARKSRLKETKKKKLDSKRK